MVATAVEKLADALPDLSRESIGVRPELRYERTPPQLVECRLSDRRSFLRAASTGIGGLLCAGLAVSPSTVLRAAEPQRRTRLAPTIVLHLLGGPPSKELWTPDPPDSPVEMRGPFRRIGTSVKDVYISELWPELAKRMDKVALLRAVDAEVPEHMEAIQRLLNPSGREYLGARLAKLRGPLPGKTKLGDVYLRARPYFSAFETHLTPKPFSIEFGRPAKGDGRPDFQPPSISDGGELAGKMNLLRSLERTGRSSLIDTEQTRSAGALRDLAVELSNGDSELFGEPFRHTRAEIERYGDNEVGRALLVAQKLIARGVAHITIVHGDWDWHSDLAKQLPPRTSITDRALGAFLDDNERRDDPISLSVTGDFNRTPRMNSSAGRDHWRHGLNVLLTGPGIKGGAVYGKMDSRGELPMGEVVTASKAHLANTIICGAGGRELLARGEPTIEEVLR